MSKVIINPWDTMFRLFKRNECRIVHPCILTNEQGITIGKEYLLKLKTMPLKKVVIQRIHLNLDCIKIKVLSIPENKSFWLRQSFEEQYWDEYEWTLLNDYMFASNN